MSVATILLYIIITLVTLLIYRIKKKFNYWKEHGIPHDKPSLIWGNFQGFLKTKNFADLTIAPYLKYKGTGPFCGFYFVQKTGVLIVDKALVKNVLIKDFSNFTDRGLFHNEEDDPLTGRLFLLDGTKWKNMRNKLSPTFSSGKMKAMYPLVINVAQELVNVFRDMNKKNNVFEIKDLLARFTTDVIGICAFGINCNSLKDPHAEFRVMGLRSLTGNRHGKLITRFIQSFPDLARKLHMRIMPDDITNFYIRIVKETVAYRQANNIKTNDFISILCDLKTETADEKVKKLTVEQMAAQAFVFFLGGFETSSSTMGFALYELALNEGIQDKLREEINDVFKEDTEIDYESMHNMPYMGQVISETLRKYPIVPIVTRRCLNEYVVPGHPKYVIKKAMPVIIPIYAIHHDPDFYPEPQIFDPDRFDAEKVKQRDPIEWLGFGDGPRNCIGLRFGLMQTRVGLTYLLRNFKFSICERTEIPLQLNKATPLLSPTNGIYLKVESI